jgi:hypothetical protein
MGLKFIPNGVAAKLFQKTATVCVGHSDATILMNTVLGQEIADRYLRGQNGRWPHRVIVGNQGDVYAVMNPNEPNMNQIVTMSIGKVEPT